MTGRLDGKVALVVGGAAGIAKAACTRLATDGASVVVLDIEVERAELVAKEITAAGGTAFAVFGDLADEASLVAAIEQTCTRYGGIDCLLNAGFLRAHQHEDVNVVDTTEEVWRRVLDVNLMGFVRTSRHVIPRMIERGGGSIVNMTTGTERRGSATLVAYSASKAAITSMTRNTALAFAAEGIRVNAVAPGPTTTENMLRSNSPEFIERMTQNSPGGRLPVPEEIASVIAFLLSEDASMVSGEVYYVDGGRGISP